MRLNPSHPLWYWGDLAIALYALARYEEALEASKAIASSNAPWWHARLAACYAQLGRIEGARGAAARVLELQPGFRVSEHKLCYKSAADRERVLEGMRKAGLPD